jgi:hypothetical protein
MSYSYRNESRPQVRVDRIHGAKRTCGEGRKRFGLTLLTRADMGGSQSRSAAAPCVLFLSFGSTGGIEQ